MSPHRILPPVNLRNILILVLALLNLSFLCYSWNGSLDFEEVISQLRLNEFKLAGGFGIRYRLVNRFSTNIRLDFGFAKGSFGVYAMINESF